MVRLLSWPESGRVLTQILGDRLETLTRLALDHPAGAIIRTPGRRLHVVTDHAVIKHVLVDNAANYHKGLGQAEARGLLGDGLLTGEGAHWQAQRTDLTPYLKARVVRDKESEVRTLAAKSVARLPATAEWTRIDLAEPLAQYTLSCLALTLGFKPPAARALIAALDVVQDEAMVLATTQGRLIPQLRPGSGRRVRQAQARLATLADEALGSLAPAEARQAWATRDGMISLLLAGYETTAATLGWTLHFLARRPSLQGEVSAEAGAARPGRVAEVFREALRLRPPVWVISRRALSADGVGEWKVRAGDDVLILPHALHRMDSWSKPHAFDPQRFTDGRVGAHLPYGAGPRGCPGAALAELEATMWLTVFLEEIEVRAPLGEAVTHHARMSQAPARADLLVRRRQG